MTGITGRNDIYKSRFFEQEPMEQLIIPGWKSQEYIKVQVGRYLRPGIYCSLFNISGGLSFLPFSFGLSFGRPSPPSK